MLRLPPWFQDALSAAAGINLRSSRSLAAIAPVVSRLAKRFMRQEDGVPENYFADADVRRAYLAYFLPTNVLKILPVLDELERIPFFGGRERVRALDLGTGVGTAPLGLWLWLSSLAHPPDVELLATDASPEVCAEAGRTIETFRRHLPRPALRFTARPVALHAAADAGLGTFDLITAQNVLVEDPDLTAVTELARTSLDPDGALVLIEPASRFGSRTLLACRDALVDAGLTIYAPCVRQEHCPALARESDWCHAVSRWERPRFVALLDEELGNLRLALKYSYVIAMKKPLNISATLHKGAGEELFRIVSDRIDEKGRRKIYGCGTKGRLCFEKQKRDTTDANRDFDDARRYDLMRIDGYAPKAALQRLAPDGSARCVKRFEAKGE